MASGAIDVNHKDETYDGKVILFLEILKHHISSHFLSGSFNICGTMNVFSWFQFVFLIGIYDPMVTLSLSQVPDIIDNAYVIVEFENGCRGMLDLCMFAEGSKNEQEISVVGDIGKVNASLSN